jgi:hypothetical protein
MPATGRRRPQPAGAGSGASQTPGGQRFTEALQQRFDLKRTGLRQSTHGDLEPQLD